MNFPNNQSENNANARRNSAGIRHSFEMMGHLNRGDTIIAVSSPPGQSTRGLIRVSGPRAIEFLQEQTNHIANVNSSSDVLPQRVALRCELSFLNLPCIAYYFPTPHSYTGDDTIELQVPGHPALLEAVISHAIDFGIRLAEPGEYTFRSFTAGKIDLTQAEGIAATIAATSDSQLRAAELLKNGKLGSFSHKMVDTVATQLALVEAGIDFVDQEDVVPIEPFELNENLAEIQNDLSQLISRSRSWGSIEALPRVVLVGEPSVGKSTLFNALLGKERAVISALPGTTRDILAEPLRLTNHQQQQIEVMLIDIAGLGYTKAAIDKQAQIAAQQAIDQADLIVHILDATQDSHDEIEPPAHIPVLKVFNKIDAGQYKKNKHDFGISAQTGCGLEELKSHITQLIGSRGISLASDMLALQPRHEHALNKALSHVKQTRDILTMQSDQHGISDIEIVAGSLREALDELAAIGGEMTPDDVIGKVFANFCVGK
ncbi:50S ribosome-binding GTPase [Planctomycetota bacterium]|nr:50S ribosome-binding GTPase [Planctomycetota bacterium]